MFDMIFFDFDGVIVDSFDAAFAVNKMIHPLLTADMYRKRFEGNINESKPEKEVEKEYRPNIDFFREYEPLLLRCDIFPEMERVVRTLSHNHRLIIISSTATGLIKKFLTLHGIEDCFLEIMGNDIHKSKIAKIGMAAAKFEIDPKRCLFITDTLGDVKEAGHVGCRTIGVSWGYQSKETLLKGRPDRIVDSASELLSAVSDKAFNGS
jgi:phosphoglycolate phosphatase